MTGREIVKKLEAIQSLYSQATEFANELAEEMETYFDERSEKWQESDKGSSFNELKGDIENLAMELDGLTIPEVDFK